MPHNHSDTDTRPIETLYNSLIDAWNTHNADSFADLFTVDANMIGFDGSMVDGSDAIRQELRQIFTDHVTAPYYTIIREVRLLTQDAAVLRSVAGMVPSGQARINPEVNATQSLVAVHMDGNWRIALFQTTPAQFHGRPDLSKALTDELQSLLDN